jgi:hypothetical protein
MSCPAVVRVTVPNGPAVVRVVTPGPQGPPGAAGVPGPAGVGSAWLQGEGAPDDELGGEGDYYLDTETGNIYGPKADGEWGEIVFNIAEGQEGPAGATGAQGPAGVVTATAPITYNAATQTVAISAATTSAAGSMSAADKGKLDGLATVATSGAYSDLSGRPTLGTAAATDATAYDTAGAAAAVKTYLEANYSKVFVYEQPTPATTWTINHNLGYKPAVEVFNTGSQEIDAVVTNTTINQTVISLNVAVAGFARLN